MFKWLKLSAAIAVEIAYAIATRVWLPDYVDGVALELLTTACRIASLIVFWLLFRDLITSQKGRPMQAVHPLVVGAVSLTLLVPILTGQPWLPDLTTKSIFAVTSLVVAIKEEFLYRGVIQNILVRHIGVIWAIVVSNIAFTLYHYGAQPFTISSLISLFTVGCLFGLLYVGSGSMVLVIALHTFGDVIWVFAPWLSEPLPYSLGSVLNVVALILCIRWVFGRFNGALHSISQTGRHE